ncbi:MAG: ZIP family metal transporter [Candidatus Bathyarchaeota archaeon]|nr:MAG: ZIP family metal transporter [Candidatus Bathyarchaeota archaeon]
MFTLALILASTILVSAISVIGILFLALKEKWLSKILSMLVSFASGSLLGGAFLHLIPESLFPYDESIFIAILIGIAVFFLLEKSLWRHCHERECPVHTFAYLNLFGDSIHNFIDGVIIAASFLSPPTPNIALGVAATWAVVAHELPQEIGDFGILVYGGFNRNKALFYNLLTAIAAIVGAMFTYFFSAFIPNLGYLLAFAAGSFIYIATTDLIPELHKERNPVRSLAQFILLSVGIAFMWALKLYAS